ncbi:MAG: hypothetical protein JSU63_21630 [Phycisphaerales bacterium]|nr:MAG: hypothetical protein JSU63_21630 [Phycisphaerales bacterium]
MPLSEDDIGIIEAFRNFVEGAVDADDRYGLVGRHDAEDASTRATRFEAGPECWLEVAIHIADPRVMVGFLTNDESLGEEAERIIKDSGSTVQAHVGEGFREAGLAWPEPPVELIREPGEYFYFGTPLDLDEIPDLEWNDIRDKVVRMLEGYLIAFGPAIEIVAVDDEDLGEEEDEDDW